MILNSGNMENLFVAYNAAFNQGFREAASFALKIATQITSRGKSNSYAWLGQFPRLREWVGDRHIKQLEAYSYSITNKKFESSVEVGRDEIEDDQHGIFTPLMTEMGYAAATHPDELLAELLGMAFEEKCYDGQPFFSASHPVKAGGKETSVSNMQDGNKAPWFLLDTRRALKPFILQKRRAYEFKKLDKPEDHNVVMRDKYLYGVDGRSNVGFGFWQQAFGAKVALDKAAFRKARGSMLALKSDEGRPLGIKPNLLVVGLSNADAARDLLLAERDASGATNIDRNLVEILEVPWLD